MSGSQASANGAGFKRILVGVDPKSPSVIGTAHYLAERLGAEVLVAHVSLTDTAVAGNERDGSPATADEQAIYDSLERLIQLSFSGGSSSKVQLKILHGDPAERLSEYAVFAHCDLVVVGSRHLGTLKSALVGSVSSALLKRSEVPLLVMK